MSRSDSAFTLLEVLAAVALLGILYTVLTEVAMQGLRGEGIARRRMEASLLADERLGEIERDLALGVPLTVGVSEEEEEEGGLLVQVEVKPFVAPEGFFGPNPDAPVEDEPDRAGEPGEAAPLASSRLGSISPNESPVLLAIDLRVSWEEGDQEMSVLRTTYGYDPAALAAALQAAEQPE